MIASEPARNVINFVLFQIGWLTCVMFPGLAAAGLVLIFLAVHFALVSQRRFVELQFIGFGVVLGSLMDTLWFQTGVLGIAGAEEVLVAPPWLVAIWAMFMTTICHSLGWMGQRKWLPYMFAPIAGPFAYWSASKLGVVTLPDLNLSLAAMAIGWLVLFPLLLFIRNSLYSELQS
ncbi:DUF2878 domain-containing protein [Marinobacter halophilus]|uniref:DUF2878 domain-containing protein n=1 Tax=Marinobacter halophilus TaxID=1323740 RepID=A0A2T1K8J7_9GAMM|nr:DUF2878 domain-containing protein [Marinobacter halophilus]PSF06348.1 DUF2878 domain-containing protein [Marinobacter halophilus]GGC71789.1 membrane protein [Marinobacter halophilus]